MIIIHENYPKEGSGFWYNDKNIGQYLHLRYNAVVGGSRGSYHFSFKNSTSVVFNFENIICNYLIEKDCYVFKLISTLVSNTTGILLPVWNTSKGKSMI